MSLRQWLKSRPDSEHGAWFVKMIAMIGFGVLMWRSAGANYAIIGEVGFALGLWSRNFGRFRGLAWILGLVILGTDFVLSAVGVV